MQAAWESIKDSIMAGAEAGTRPWAFYRFAREPRLRFPVLYGFGPAGWKHYPIGTKGLFDSRPSEQEETKATTWTGPGNGRTASVRHGKIKNE